MNRKTYSKPVVEIKDFEMFDILTISRPIEGIEGGDGGELGGDNTDLGELFL